MLILLLGNDPVQVGLRGLPIGFSILLGAVVCLVLLGATKGRIRLLLVFFSVCHSLAMYATYKRLTSLAGRYDSRCRSDGGCQYK